MKDTYREAFKEEACELLAELETSSLELEELPDDSNVIGRVFRALHTIKGSGAMFGFDDIAAFTHEVEAVFDLVRNNKIRVTKELVDLTLTCGDMIRAMLAAGDSAEKAEDLDTAPTVAALRSFMLGSDMHHSSAPPVKPPEPSPSTGEDKNDCDPIYHIHFRPKPFIFTKGINPILMLQELCELGDCRVTAGSDAIPTLADIDPERCYTYWDILLATSRSIDEIREVFIFVEDECELRVESLEEKRSTEEDLSEKKLGEILLERGTITPEVLEKALRKQKRIGEILVDGGAVGAIDVESALAEQRQRKELREKRQMEEQASSVRVPAEKLDRLVDLVGELVTVQARFSQMVSSDAHSELLSVAEEVERLTVELRDNTLSIRMLPIGTIFNKFKRMVRDLSAELGKDVMLVTDGAETELDKTVIDHLNDPLMHLVRNSIDHGIETPDKRQALGKPRQGTVQLSALHSGASVLIRIEDDGAGLDSRRIRTKATERGLITQEAELSERELFALIFAPGFSTAEQVTSVSGRGVGMDVVKRGIESLRGSIDIRSEKGRGTTITLKLPLTLAIIDGLLVQVGEGSFVLPLSIVEECVELTRDEASRSRGGNMTYLRGEIVPYIRLRERFRIFEDAPEIEQIVVTEGVGGRVGFVVDKVIGEHQTVIKNLGKMYKDVQWISGATILGDGTVALILDTAQLVRNVKLEENAVR